MHALHILHLLHLLHVLHITHGGLWQLIPNVRGGYAVCHILPVNHGHDLGAFDCQR